MRIFRPIQTNRIVQSFGEAKACAIQLVNGQLQVFSMPLSGTCPVGQKNLYTEILGMKGHNGFDHATWHGEPLYFPVDIPGAKWRAKTEVDNAGGIGIDVVSKEVITFEGYIGYLKFKFWHLMKVSVADSEEVKLGQLLGFCDTTGLSSGDHLHWSMAKCDVDGNPLDRWNGYYGKMDFAPWFENKFVITHLQLVNAEAQIKTAQLTLIQILTKLIFQFQEQIRKVAQGIGGLLRK